MTMPTISKTVVPYSATPTADRTRAWNASAAVKRLRKAAGGPDKENVAWPKYRRGFVRYDADNTDDYGGYHGPHHDVIDGELRTVFRGCAALATVMSGGRGGMKIPDDEVAGVKAHVAKHYKQFDEKAPWERDEKDFAWLPEERRAAKAMGFDLAEMQTALFAPDGAGVAKEGCPCEDGDTTMSTRVLVIRNDADVSEEIETPADGVFDEDVAAVSTDDGETWLELQDGRIKDEADADPAPEGDDGDPEGESEGDDAEEPEGDEEDPDGESEGDDTEEPEGDEGESEGDDADESDESEGDDTEEPEGDKDAKPDLALDHSLLGELAETGYMRYLWNLTYALSDVLIGLIGDDDLAVDDKIAKGDKALSEFVDLAKSSFSEAVNISADEEEPDAQDPFAGMSFADVVRSALAEADGLDVSDASSEDVNEIAADVAELQTKLAEATAQGSVKQEQLDEAKRLIDDLLDMPLERKIDGDTDEDAVVDINEKYPWLDPTVRRKLAAAKVK
jgi:hypothetical protein